MVKTPCISLRRGRGGLTKVVLRHVSGARAEIYPHGAHLTAWRAAYSDECLFLSRRSVFSKNQPIRGGIPVVFPQFGDGPLPKHGFARQSVWKLTRSAINRNGDLTLVLGLSDNAATRALWPHAFELEFVITLGADCLEMRLTIRNPGNKPLSCQAALHTYLRVGDITQTALSGLQGTVYRDFLPPYGKALEKRCSIKCCGETDRVYLCAPNRLQLHDGANRRKILIDKQNMPDIVLWNPWIAKSRRLADLENSAWQNMICVETGRLHKPLLLRPGASWMGRTLLKTQAALT